LGLFVDVDSAAQPGSWLGLEAVVESPSDSSIYYWSGLSVSPPSGTTTLSGTVITTGGAPVGAACVFVISSPLFIWPAVTDSSGSWSVGGLPDDYTFIVGVVPPFTGTYGPCANDGPPPIPGPGDLQPVFVDSIWVDLANPALTGGQGDPYVFAVNAGARVLSTSESGIEACLSTAPSTQVPRPPCVASVVTTTSTTVAGELPLTGPDDNLALGAVALLGAGLALLGTVRRKTV
jgi:LPXTG-motif cell wall-anchored protein